MTDSQTMFSYDTWWGLYDQLKGTQWEDEDVDLLRFYKNDPAPTAPAAEALKYVYDRAKEWQGTVDPEDGVAAAMNAVHEHAAMNGWAPLWLKEMADHFAVFYEKMEDPLRDYLDDHHGNLPPEWLTEQARKNLEKGLRKQSEIWVTEGPPGVWVFNKPGRAAG